MTEKFQTEPETRSLSLWLGGDQGFYNTLRDMAQEVKEDHQCEGHESLAGEHMGEEVYCDGSCVPQADLIHDLADRIKDWWEGYTDPENWTPEFYVKAVVPIIADVGSAWRIDWDSIAEEFLEG